MFGMAGETPFDLRFRLLGVPVRVHPIFWLTGAFMFWDPDRLERVLIGMLCLFVSVLVHEMGHALVFRHYRWPSEIVLYFLGGYATATRLSTWKQIWSLAAGPLAGIVFSLVIYAIKVLLMKAAPDVLDQYPLLEMAFFYLLFSGVIVNLMNLVPCLPLDGGQIMATLVSHYGPRGRAAGVLALRISIISGAAVALWCAYCQQSDSPVVPMSLFALVPLPYRFDFIILQPDPQFMMIFFGILAAQSVIQHNELNRW